MTIDTDVKVADMLAAAIAKVHPHLASSLTIKQRIHALWAGAKAARHFDAADVVKEAFTKLAHETGLTHDLGRYGKEDLAHVLSWALRGWNPFF
jgi:hypothetical protein